MAEYLKVIDAETSQPSSASLQLMRDLALRFLCVSTAASVHKTPQNHFFMHMVHETARLGNPNDYATFEDESINQTLANIARAGIGHGVSKAFVKKEKLDWYEFQFINVPDLAQSDPCSSEFYIWLWKVHDRDLKTKVLQTIAT